LVGRKKRKINGEDLIYAKVPKELVNYNFFVIHAIYRRPTSLQLKSLLAPVQSDCMTVFHSSLSLIYN